MTSIHSVGPTVGVLECLLNERSSSIVYLIRCRLAFCCGENKVKEVETILGSSQGI